MMSLFLYSRRSRHFAIKSKSVNLAPLSIRTTCSFLPPNNVASLSLSSLLFQQQKQQQQQHQQRRQKQQFWQQRVLNFHSCAHILSSSNNQFQNEKNDHNHRHRHLHRHQNQNQNHDRRQHKRGGPQQPHPHPQRQRQDQRHQNHYNKNLLTESKTFLDNVEQMNITSVEEKTREIVRLVYKWNNTWNSSSKMYSSSSSSSSNSTSTSTSPSTSSSITCTAESIDIVDRLIHLLLDIIETKLQKENNDNNDNNNNDDNGQQRNDDNYIQTSYQEVVDMALGAWSNTEPTTYSGRRAQILLDRVEYIYHNYYTTTIINSSVTDAAAAGGGSDGGDVNFNFHANVDVNGNVNANANANANADRIQKGVLPFRPTVLNYGAAIKAWAYSIDNNDDEEENNNNDYGNNHDDGNDNKNKNKNKNNDKTRKNGAQRAQMLLDRMEYIYSTGKNDFVRPNLMVYNTCLHGYAHRGMIDEAEDLLTKLEEFCNDDEQYRTKNRADNDNDIDNDNDNDDNDEFNLCPDVYTYTIYLNAYQKYKGRTKGLSVEKRAVNILRKMMDKYEQTGNIRFMPNQFTFGTAISIAAHTNTESGALTADKMLHWMLELDEKLNLGNEHKNLLQPSTEHFISVLRAHGQRKNKKAACARIEELLVEMEKLRDAGFPVKPTFKCFVIYLNALTKSGIDDVETKSNAVLSRMEDLYVNSKDSGFTMNNYGYNLVIDAITRSRKRGKAERAEAIIQRMSDLSKKTGNKSLLPDKVSYTCLLKAILKDRTTGFVTKCESILKKMEDEYSNGNVKVKPDLKTYGTVLNVLANERCPEECEAFVDKMERLALAGDHEVFPNIICYNIVMSSYDKSKRNDAAQQTVRILQKIHDARSAGNRKAEANTASYAICINALARSNNRDKVEKAEALLQTLLELDEKNSRDNRYSPSQHIFNALMLVYAESKRPDKAEMALSVLRRMENAGVQPDNVSYNTLLKACVKTNVMDDQVRKRILDISRDAFEEMQQKNYLQPDSFTYGNLLWVCNKLIDEDGEEGGEQKRATIRSLFQNCCSSGQANSYVIGTLEKVAPYDLYLELISVGVGSGGASADKKFVDVKDLPAEWSRNVKRKR